MVFRINRWSDAAIEVWESPLHRSIFFPIQGGRLSHGLLSVLRNILAIFMPKTIQARNTFKDRFFVDIARENVFIVQILDSFVQKSGVREVLDILQFFEYT